jgi:hypothetical protein
VLLADDKAEQQWKLFYDPDAERFCHIPAGRHGEVHWVPVKSLANMLGVLAESRRLLTLDPEKATLWVQRLERVARAITEYQIPVIGYSGDLSSAIEIFARLNQKGKTMGPDELLSALSYRETPGQKTFRLADEIDSVLNDIDAEGFGAVNRTFILRAILAAADLDIYPQNWDRMAKDLQGGHQHTDLRDAVETARTGIISAIEFLRTEGIHSVRQLSYGMQLVALSAFLGIDQNPDPETRFTLARMLWASSFTSWFGSPAQERPLIRELRALAKQRAQVNLLASFDLETPALPMPSQVDQKSARVRALINVLAAQSPRRVDGTVISPKEVGQILLTREAGSLVKIVSSGAELITSPANRVLAVSHKSGTARPWLRAIAPEHRDDVLRSLAIPPDAFSLLEANESERFLQARLAYLDQLEREFMRAKGVTEPKPGAKPAPSPIDTDD